VEHVFNRVIDCSLIFQAINFATIIHTFSSHLARLIEAASNNLQSLHIQVFGSPGLHSEPAFCWCGFLLNESNVIQISAYV
jgi:hypothetical protein